MAAAAREGGKENKNSLVLERNFFSAVFARCSLACHGGVGGGGEREEAKAPLVIVKVARHGLHCFFRIMNQQ